MLLASGGVEVLISTLSESPSVVKSSPQGDLDIAAYLVAEGVPLVIAHKRKGHAFSLESEWQHTPADMRNYFRWLNGEGDMLACITGHVYDVFDFDVQNNGSLSEYLQYLATLGHTQLTVQAISRTPSGGFHVYVKTLKRRKCPIARGIDYQGLNGIAFIPPSRKLSKTSDATIPYEWLEFSPGGDDDGQLIYDSLSEWPNHRPVPSNTNRSSESAGHHGLTKADVRRYRREGIPDGENHDDTLRDIVWSLVLWHASKDTCQRYWEEVVSRTDNKAGRRPFEERDFERHWRGAERKLRGDL